jgi:hypothetical protein
MKRMARLCLIAPPSAALNLLVLMHNLLLKHPPTIVLLHRTTTDPQLGIVCIFVLFLQTAITLPLIVI